MRLPKIKGQLKTTENSDGHRLVLLSINFNKDREFISMNLTCKGSDWNPKKRECYTSGGKGHTVSKKAGIINNELERHKKIATAIIKIAENKLDLGEAPDLNFLTSAMIKGEILARLGRKKPEVSSGKHSLFEYIEGEALAAEERGEIGTARRYRTAAKMFKNYLGKDIAFEDLTSEIIRSYYKRRLDGEKVEDGKGKKKVEGQVKQSTAYVSVRVLKTLYRRGIRRMKLKVIDVFLEIEPDEIKDSKASAKGKLEESDLKRIRDLKLNGRLEMSRDLFLFCYYNAGTRVRDAILLKPIEVFQESKTGNAHAIYPKAQKILEKYKGGGKYVFGYLRDDYETPKQLYNAASSATTLINRDLKDIAKLAGLSEYWQEHLSSHIARHTAILNFQSKSGDIYMTSQAVGHANPKQTAQYLKTHSPNLIDKKIADIMNKL